VLDALVEQPRKQDIAQAKALLAAAGFPNGVSVDLYTSDATAGMVQLATIFQQQAAPAGINVNIKQADPSSYWDNIWLKQPFVASSWSGRAAIDALATPYLSTSQWNETHWYNSSFDALIKKAQGTVDPAARKTILEQAQKMVIDEGGALIPIFVDALSATRSNVTGWKLGVQKFYKDFRNVSFA
jgi:peptide/nickel transport system substrate-binding protein